MVRAHYTAAALARTRGSFGPADRFVQEYGLPEGREHLSQYSIRPKYGVIKKLVVPGALNRGIIKVKKLEGEGAGELRIVKQIGFDPREGRILLREIEILYALRHPNIVEFIEAHIPTGPEGTAQLCVDYCDKGSLQDLLDEYVKYNKHYEWPNHPYENIPEAFIWHAFRSLASALAYLHHGVRHDDLKNPPQAQDDWPYILHRDIKPENILLKSPPSTSQEDGSMVSTLTFRSKYPTVVLADFGVCTQQNEDQYNRYENDDIECGTFAWQPPEIPEHSMQGEVYTVGMMMMSLCNQWSAGPVHPRYVRSYKGRKDIWRMKIAGDYYTLDLVNTIRRTLVEEKNDRPFADELLGLIRRKEAKIRPMYEPLPKFAFSEKKGENSSFDEASMT